MTSRTVTIALGAACLLASTAAVGQEQIIERCKQTSSKDDRIACLEAALLMREDAAASTGDEGIDADAAPVVEPVRQPSPPATPQVSGTPPQPGATAAEPGSGKPESARPTGIGAEQVIARQQTQQEMIAALERAEGLEVSKYETLPHGRLQVHLTNGQVWRQIRGDTQNVRVSLRSNQTVNIEESSLGGYKLRMNEIRRTIRVQRIR